ncbi:sulfotransferase 1B1-like [Mytilus californianus]|uniref:sulfotransferase 1B1-like n=1 Tax=Mytilus californianus TaxID=6549 RepID=UPI002246D912|nr:sulfotransferase 1B1-like [Mytilus californianus]
MKLPHMSPTKKDVDKFMDSVRNFNSRETDVIICSAMKSGTHWVHEIVSMLLHQTTEYNSHGELNDCNFECQTDWDRLEQWNSPRLFQTHLPLKYLPRKHVENEYKIIYLNRNPKDRAVSNFYFMQKKGVPVGSWKEFFDNFVLIDSLYGGWFSFTKEFEKAASQKRDNILPVTFEKLTTVSQSNEKTHFILGIIGDWKNLFTVAQNEKFDQIYEQEMKGCDVKFTYNS